MQRSQSKLRDLLHRGKVDLKVDNPPLLTLAIGWPVGLELLLKAGAEPSVAIEEAILQQQHESIGLLLDHGCPVFVSMFGQLQDMVDIAISSHVSPSVVLLLVERLAARRQELLQLALDHLPEAVIETSWCHYHARPRPLLDYQAIEIYEQLKARGVEVPQLLWPGPYTTIYHSQCVLKNSSLAMKLYDLGFHDIDKADGHGTTPLIKAIKACGSDTDDCPRLIQWYLDMGVTLGSFSTHVLSQSTCFPSMVSARVWISPEQKLYGILEIFRQLSGGDAQTNDDCRCWCSTMGCTPIGVVLRKKAWTLFWFSCALQLRGRRRWLYLLPRYSSLGLNLNQNCFTEIYRLEIFDRLGMAHTCCHRLEVCPQNDFPITRNELEELQEEDQSLKEALDLYLELYLDLLRQHQGGFESFWISWWFAVDRFLPFDCPGNSNEEFLPLRLPGFPEYELCCETQDVNGYSPNITALTSTVHLCVTLLDAIGIDSFLDQLKAYSFYG